MIKIILHSTFYILNFFGASQIIFHFAPTIFSFSAGNGIITAGTATSLTASYSGGTGNVDHGVGTMVNGVPVPVSPSYDTTYMLTPQSNKRLTYPPASPHRSIQVVQEC